MRPLFTLLLCLATTLPAAGQSQDSLMKITFTLAPGPTLVTPTGAGGLAVRLSPRTQRRLARHGQVSYRDFGAVGDGQTDDMDAIAAAHAYANAQDLPVVADPGATYYLGGSARTAVIQTDTDWGEATLLIDDRAVTDRMAPIFVVRSRQEAFSLTGITRLRRHQPRIEADLPGPCLITVTNDAVRHYIRYGLNQDNGSPQTDIFAVDAEGRVDMNAPIIWDFDQITDISALPIDADTLHLRGGRFTTLANAAESRYTYYSRNITIQRSRVVVDKLEHRIEGEGAQGAPYGGFLNIRDCAYVTVQNTLLTGHKTYMTIGAAGKPVPMGSYDLLVNRALNVSFVHCTQTNDIDDRTYWGILGSNYSKNLLYDHCVLSRFDAHKGVANATIRHSTLGHMGINAIGSGTLTIEHSEIRGPSIVNLRSDYGSTWQGDLIIHHCTLVPAGGRPVSAVLVSGSYSGKHDFGYPCYMPHRILIENLHIEDAQHPDDYAGPAIFADFNPEHTDASYQEAYPYTRTQEVILRGVTTASGLPLRLSDNPYMFREVQVRRE
ncbi:MAG: hypothetical protein D6722_04205 [Bacteroidetes bacterium]|nr:MAG: hypothetical protein D6722_04205 [Bacteroidota bacterium]